MQREPKIVRMRAVVPDAAQYAQDVATPAWIYCALDGDRLVCWAPTASETRRLYQEALAAISKQDTTWDDWAKDVAV